MDGENERGRSNLSVTRSYEACLLFPMFRENSSQFMAFQSSIREKMSYKSRDRKELTNFQFSVLQFASVIIIKKEQYWET